ncbi:MAG: ABC transporter permease [Rhodobiaceae bacterium]|nr:ABC transporter permease [Rhodobiaceae bacterium]MCC0052090.1 ABC transporter permease [Rhodobiaceae bacterium]MCC0061389.1 ABC transporter permease [Rhodobiaceae bacterium]
MSPVMAIARTEARLGIRNSWVLLSTVILTVFAVLLVLLGSGATGEVDASLLAVSIASLSTLSVYLIPLIALLLSFDAIAGEIDRGTLQLVLATPIARWQLLVGKFLGHLAVLTIAIVISSGIAAILAIALDGNPGPQPLGGLAALAATSILLGAVFIAVGYIASASVRQTGTAAALAVGIWLGAVVLYDLALLGGLLASGEGVFARTIFPWLLLLNPADAFRLYNMSATDTALVQTGLGAVSGSPLAQGAWVLASPLAWTLAAISVAVVLLGRVRP